MKICSIWVDLLLSTADTIYFSLHAGEDSNLSPSNRDVSTRNLYWQIWTDRSHLWVDSTTNSRRAGQTHWEEALLGSKDTDAAPTAGSQGKAPLLPYQCWSFICKLPCCCTMERTLSSSVKWIVCCSSHAWQQHLILRGGRVFWQIHEVQEAWGNQDHIPAAAADRQTDRQTR